MPDFFQRRHDAFTGAIKAIPHPLQLALLEEKS
jgi:hypothetical protein